MSAAWNGLLNGFGQLLAFFYDLVPNYGVAIILLTIAVRLAMLPLTIKQIRSVQLMQKLHPELSRLKTKHKEDKQKLAEETMKLYREHGGNPYGGCLPMILQLPVFIALYRVLDGCRGKLKQAGKCKPGLSRLPEGTALYAAIDAGQAGFLGMNLLLTPSEALRTLGVIGGLPYLVLVAAMGITGWVQARQSQAMQSGAQDATAAQMQMMGKILPIMFTVFSFTFPAGLTVYWVATNLLTILQQHLLVGRARQASALGGQATPAQGTVGNPGSEPPLPPKRKGSGAKRKRRRR